MICPHCHRCTHCGEPAYPAQSQALWAQQGLNIQALQGQQGQLAQSQQYTSQLDQIQCDHTEKR